MRLNRLEQEVTLFKSAIIMLATADLNASEVSTERSASPNGQSEAYRQMLDLHDRMFNLLSITPEQNSDE
jgi:hypothetical protein